MYYVYLLESKKYDEIYVGSTNDLRRRLKEHNEGKEISTKRYLPWVLVSYESYRSEKDARHREKMFKQHGNDMRQFKIKSQNSFLNKKASSRTIFFSKKNSAGFTLIEALIYLAIIGGVVAAFVNFSLSVSQSRGKTYVVQEVQANSRIALDMITRTIQSASGIDVASSTFDIDPGVLSLSMTSSTINPTVIDLSQDDGVLQITEGQGAPVPITSDEVKITNLQFVRLNQGNGRQNIRVFMTVAYGVTEDVTYSYSQSLQTAVTLRK